MQRDDDNGADGATAESVHASSSSPDDRAWPHVDEILASLADGISIQNRQFEILYQNEPLRRLVGDGVGRRCHEIYHGRDRPCVGCPVARCFVDGKVHVAEIEIDTVPGMVIESTASPMRDTDGNVVAVIEVVRDISERKLMERDVGSSHQTLLSLLESQDAMVYVADLEHDRILFANRGVRERFGDVEGKVAAEVLSAAGGGARLTVAGLRLLDEQGQPSGVVRWEQHDPEQDRWFDARDRALRWSDGRLVRLRVAFDITERHRREKRLERRIAQLEAQQAGTAPTLSGLLPICAGCKRVRIASGAWEDIETYVAGHSSADFTHGLCPSCTTELYPESKRR